MTKVVPHPWLLALTLLIVVAVILYLDSGPGMTQTDAAGGTRTAASPEPDAEMEPENDDPARANQNRSAARKENEFQRAEEISAPAGFVNARDVSVEQARGKVVLLEFWTYTCFNCQNVQPHLNTWHEKYADDGLRIIGVHTPEFGFERNYANVEKAVREAGIEYPVVLDNSYATWNAYDNRYWPAMYLIDADGFVRYKHFGEGAYGETEDTIRKLLAEKERTARGPVHPDLPGI